jgi:hypothetical protein
LNIGFGELLTFPSDHRVAFFHTKEAEKDSRIHSRQKSIHFQAQIISEAMKIGAAALIYKNFE